MVDESCAAQLRAAVADRQPQAATGRCPAFEQHSSRCPSPPGSGDLPTRRSPGVCGPAAHQRRAATRPRWVGLVDAAVRGSSRCDGHRALREGKRGDGLHHRRNRRRCCRSTGGPGLRPACALPAGSRLRPGSGNHSGSGGHGCSRCFRAIPAAVDSPVPDGRSTAHLRAVGAARDGDCHGVVMDAPVAVPASTRGEIPGGPDAPAAPGPYQPSAPRGARSRSRAGAVRQRSPGATAGRRGGHLHPRRRRVARRARFTRQPHCSGDPDSLLATGSSHRQAHDLPSRVWR